MEKSTALRSFHWEAYPVRNCLILIKQELPSLMYAQKIIVVKILTYTFQLGWVWNRQDCHKLLFDSFETVLSSKLLFWLALMAIISSCWSRKQPTSFYTQLCQMTYRCNILFFEYAKLVKALIRCQVLQIAPKQITVAPSLPIYELMYL